MRRWAPLSSSTSAGGPAPNDPGVWNDISNMWPTAVGSYAVVDPYVAGSNMTATGESIGSLKHAFAAATPGGTICYVVGAKIWEVGSAGTTLTDRTNSVTVGSPHMAQFGNATICAMGTGNATVVATGGNFAALGGSPPSANIAVVQSNVVLLLNVNDGTLKTDGWHASDVADHTNWSTNESANGRLLQTPGPIVGGVAFGGYVYAFKQGSIYRGTYVGGTVKWAWEVVCRHTGLGSTTSGFVGRHALVSCRSGIAFISNGAASSASDPSGLRVSLYTGSGDPIPLNPDTYLTPPNTEIFLTYDPAQDILTVHGKASSPQYFYNFRSGLWGKAASHGVTGKVPVTGNGTERVTYFGSISTARPQIFNSDSNTITLFSPQPPTSSGTINDSAPFIETAFLGDPTIKTSFNRLFPILRRRETRSGGSPSVALSMTTQTELHGGTVSGPTSVTESGQIAAFDLTGVPHHTNTFAKFKLTFTDLAVEIEDVLVRSTHAGSR